jgi:hypothetical protein
VFLMRSLDLGGAQRQLIELATGLHRSNGQVKVLVFYGGGELEADLLKRGVKVQSLAKSGDGTSLASRISCGASRAASAPTSCTATWAPRTYSTAMRPFVPKMRVVWGVRGNPPWSATSSRLFDHEGRSTMCL